MSDILNKNAIRAVVPCVAPQVQKSVADAVIASKPALDEAEIGRAVSKVIDKQVYQDRPALSWRTWSANLSVVTAFLLDPAIRDFLFAVLPEKYRHFVPVATAALAASLGYWSKLRDGRPVRPKGK